MASYSGDQHEREPRGQRPRDGDSEHQTVMQRRAIAAGGIVLFLIVVVGAGPAGLEAAWVAAARRHEVILIEAEAEVGGLVRTAAQLPGRAERAGCGEWREQECERRGVDIRLNTRADGALLAGLEPEVVVLATGAGGAGD